MLVRDIGSHDMSKGQLRRGVHQVGANLPSRIAYRSGDAVPAGT